MAKNHFASISLQHCVWCKDSPLLGVGNGLHKFLLHDFLWFIITLCCLWRLCSVTIVFPVNTLLLFSLFLDGNTFLKLPLLSYCFPHHCWKTSQLLFYPTLSANNSNLNFDGEITLNSSCFQVMFGVKRYFPLERPQYGDCYNAWWAPWNTCFSISLLETSSMRMYNRGCNRGGAGLPRSYLL